MKKDQLEQFIVQNRAAFNIESPRPTLWTTIEKALPPKQSKTFGIWRFTRMAAAVAALLIIGIAIGRYSVASKQEIVASIGANPQEYAEMERFFQQQIQQKKTVLASYNYKDRSLTEDLQQLDSALEELKSELQFIPRGSEEFVINAMIKNYETKINILERVLNRIQSTNQSKNL